MNTRAAINSATVRQRRAARIAAAVAIAVGSIAPIVRAAGSLDSHATFDAYSPLSRSTEIARRVLTPLTYRRAQLRFTDLEAQPIDLSQERFAVYVPDGPAPPGGYGLLVFIPPWREASLPDGWSPILDRDHMIFVSAANSGNDAGTLDRRVPLALVGYENIRRRYAIDPNRVYVGGMSGGSRVALRVALAYPDVFRGALLNAGSDPIGTDAIALPPDALMRRFQASSRIVLVTGERDEVNRHNDLVSEKSLRAWCALDVDSFVQPRRGHAVMDAAGLAKALDRLDAPRGVDPAKLDACRKSLDRDLAARVAEVSSMLDRHDANGADHAIKAIDARYGGMAESAIDDLARRLGALR